MRIFIYLLFMNSLLFAQNRTRDFEIKSEDFVLVKDSNLININVWLVNNSDKDTLILNKESIDKYWDLSDAKGYIYDFRYLTPCSDHHGNDSNKINSDCYSKDFLLSDRYLTILPKSEYHLSVNFNPHLRYDKIRRQKGDTTQYLFFLTLNIPRWIGSACDKIVVGNYTTKEYYFYTILD